MKNNKLIITSLCLLVILVLLVSILVFLVFNVINTKENINKIEKLNDEILDIPSFDKSGMEEITKEKLKEIFDIDENYIENVIGKVPLFNISSSMYVVIEVNSSEYVNLVKEKLEFYAKNYENTWESYMEDQYNLVLNREISSKGKYVYLIISDDKNDVLNLINKIL